MLVKNVTESTDYWQVKKYGNNFIYCGNIKTYAIVNLL